jgi:GAF domain-containing protein
VLGLAPEVAADLLRNAVHTMGELHDDGSAGPARADLPLPTNEETRTLEPMPETRQAMAELMTRDGPDIDEVLAALGQVARQLVPQVVGLSLGMVREGVTFTLIASNSGLGALDATQYLDGGPCVEVTEKRRDVVQFDTDDPLDEGRWLLFAQTSAAVGVASSLSLPILRGGQVIGGINLYASTANAFTGHHDQLADALGASASDVVTNADVSFATRLSAARAPRQLRDAHHIETASGMLAARADRDVDQARARLRDASARAGVDEALVARLMILVHAG